MGMNMSFMGGKGPSTYQVLLINTLFKQVVDKDIHDFEDFLIAFLDVIRMLNNALPGKHYEAPSQRDLKDLFGKWKEANNEEARMNLFKNLMNEKVNLNKVDESMIITGIVAPPAAMVAKRTGQTMPQLRLMKAIPDVVFVPTATLMALAGVKILRSIIIGKMASRDQQTETAGKQLPEPAKGTEIEEQPEGAPPPGPEIEEQPELAKGTEIVEQPEHRVSTPDAKTAIPPGHKKGYCVICKRVH